jgi:hypothetical protein
MARTAPDDDLPQGVVPLPAEGKAPGGCGLRGCLYGVVALFALLLAILVAFALFRAWPTPAVAP